MSEAVADPSSPQKKSGVKLVVLALAGVLLVGGGAGGAWFALGRGHKAGEEEAPKHAAKHEKKPLFTTLEPFTVNLQDARGERFAQVGVTLQFDDPEIEGTIKDHLPAVRNDILMLISSKDVEELLSPDGKRKLAEQIKLQAGRAIGADLPEPGDKPAKHPVENPIHEVLFSQFIVQ